MNKFAMVPQASLSNQSILENIGSVVTNQKLICLKQNKLSKFQIYQK